MRDFNILAARKTTYPATALIRPAFTAFQPPSIGGSVPSVESAGGVSGLNGVTENDGFTELE
ncbi:hypothetical protein [Catelliglobosispora koreensis]|uniref:hypothetical protein n=1 Tax=Catelliglobosispora koreensis TaxID=129052 RepID=UPI0003763402|nr:hypothetical protein [Catelliglobosispora koreensis]